MGLRSSCLGKKKKKKPYLNFHFHSYKNICKIQGLIALIEDKFLLNALNNLVLYVKATSLILISISVLC